MAREVGRGGESDRLIDEQIDDGIRENTWDSKKDGKNGQGNREWRDRGGVEGTEEGDEGDGECAEESGE